MHAQLLNVAVFQFLFIFFKAVLLGNLRQTVKLICPYHYLPFWWQFYICLLILIWNVCWDVNVKLTVINCDVFVWKYQI